MNSIEKKTECAGKAYCAPSVDCIITKTELGFCSSVENFYDDSEYPWNE